MSDIDTAQRSAGAGVRSSAATGCGATAVLPPAAQISGARQVINILSQEIDEAQKVIDAIQAKKNG